MGIQTPSQVPVTTAPFAGGSIPGLDAGQVPGIPSQGGGVAPQTADPNDKVKQIIALIQQAAQRKQVANTAVPSALPAGGDVEAARNIGMNTARPGAWGTQRFLATLGAIIKNGVRKQKEDQLLKAEGDWTYLQASLNELYQAQQSGDQNAIAAAQRKVDVITNDPKKLKNMAKSLNQDWLSPEKTTVYGEALKRVVGKQQQQDQTNQQKEKAASGLKAMFQRLIKKTTGGPKPQLTDDERQRIGREVQEKAPTTTPDLATQIKAMQPVIAGEERKQLQEMKDQALKEIEKEKEDFKKSIQKPVDKVMSEAKEAFDKGDMEGYQAKLKEATQLTAASHATQPNQLALIQKANAGDADAAKTLKTYWDSQKELAKSRGEGFGMGRAMWTIAPYLDAETGQIVPMSNFDALNAIKQGKQLTPSGKLSANLVVSTQQLVSEATPALEGVRANLKAFDNSNDKLIFARVLAGAGTPQRGQEATWLGNVLNTALKGDLSPEGKAEAQQLARFSETMGRLRSTLGLPATEGAMNLTLSLLPGPTTPDSKYAKSQVDLLENMIKNAVEIPSLKNVSKSQTGMETQTYNGATYQRKKGSNDPWTLATKPQ